MIFSFNVKLTDEDYLLFNEFTLKHSDIGKKTDRISRLLVCIIIAVAVLNLLITQGINSVSVITTVVLLGIGVFLCLCAKEFNSRFTKIFTKRILKSNKKKPYTPDSTLEFYDDSFKEISLDGKSEINYSAVDKVAFVRNRFVLIFIDSIRGYIIPVDCFENDEQETAFADFIKTKCNSCEFYDKI